MKKIKIYEPAMCCSTGLCGVGVDPELLRISTTLNTLQKKGIIVERYNLSNSPQEFVANEVVNELILTEGVEILPVTVVDGQVKITKRYPTNQEFITLLGVSGEDLGIKESKQVDNCGCKGGCC